VTKVDAVIRFYCCRADMEECVCACTFIIKTFHLLGANIKNLFKFLHYFFFLGVQVNTSKYHSSRPFNTSFT